MNRYKVLIAGLLAVAGQLPAALVCGQGVAQQAGLRLGGTQREIGLRHGGLHRQAHGRQVSGAGLGAGARRSHSAAHAAPQVQLPAGIEPQGMAGADAGRAAAIGQAAAAAGAPTAGTGPHGGQLPGAAARHRRLGRAQACDRKRDVLVVDGGLLLQVVQGGIAIQRPPGLGRRPAGLRGPPHAAGGGRSSLFVGGGRGDLGALMDGLRAASRQQRHRGEHRGGTGETGQGR